MTNKKLTDIWLLITALNTARYAIAEIDPRSLPSNTKMRYNNLRNNIENFLRMMNYRMPIHDRKELDMVNFDIVGTAVEALSLISHLPEEKHEEFLQKINEYVFDAVK